MAQHGRSPYYNGVAAAVPIGHASPHAPHTHPHAHALSTSAPLPMHSPGMYMGGLSASAPMAHPVPPVAVAHSNHAPPLHHSLSTPSYDWDDGHDDLHAAEIANAAATAALLDDDLEDTVFDSRPRRHSEQVMGYGGGHAPQRGSGGRRLASSMSLPHGMLTSHFPGGSSPKSGHVGGFGLQAQGGMRGGAHTAASDLNPHAHPFVLSHPPNGKHPRAAHRQVIALQRGLSLSGDEDDDTNMPTYARQRRASAIESSTPSAESLRRRRHSLESIDFRFANVVDVPSFLRALRLHKYTETFTAAGVTMESLLAMEEHELAALGVSAQGARRRLMLAVRKFADSGALQKAAGGVRMDSGSPRNMVPLSPLAASGTHSPTGSLPSPSEFLSVQFEHLLGTGDGSSASSHSLPVSQRNRSASPSISIENADSFRAHSPTRSGVASAAPGYLQGSLGRTGSASSMGSIEEQPFGSERERDCDSGHASSPHGSAHGDDDENQLEASLRMEGERLLGLISDGGQPLERPKSPGLRVPSPRQQLAPPSPSKSPRSVTPSSSASSLHSAVHLLSISERNVAEVTAADVDAMPGGRPLSLGLVQARSAEAPAVLARNPGGGDTLQPDSATRQRRRHSIAVVNHSYYWRKPDIRDWLRSLRLHKYTDTLLRQGVDFERLSCMSEDEMAGVGVTTAGARKRLAIAMEDYRRQMERAMAAISAGVPPLPLVMPAGFSSIGGSESNSGAQSPAGPAYTYGFDLPSN